MSTGPSIFPLSGSTEGTGVHLGPLGTSTCGSSQLKVSTSYVYQLCLPVVFMLLV